MAMHVFRTTRCSSITWLILLAALTGASGAAAQQRGTDQPSETVSGCYRASWKPRPGWFGAPVTNTLRLGRADPDYMLPGGPPGGPTIAGTGPILPLRQKIRKQGAASWRMHHDTLIIASPGWNESIALKVLPVQGRYEGIWVHRVEGPKEPFKGAVSLRKISCVTRKSR